MESSKSSVANKATSSTGILDLLDRCRGIFALITLAVVIWLTHVEPKKTRAHVVKVNDYQSLSSAIAPLIANDARTYALCMKRKNVAQDRALATSPFTKEFKTLHKRRYALTEYLDVATVGIENSFGKDIQKQVQWYLSWNQQLNQAKEDVCEQKLLTKNELDQWRSKLMEAMHASID